MVHTRIAWNCAFSMARIAGTELMTLLMGICWFEIHVGGYICSAFRDEDVQKWNGVRFYQA